ncbi:DNA replication ATP-dependent helicase/nuclease DNA2 [Diplonema papillatum]|nr:DNA replication ATP-dependent helicase/nuclease DNA2 [Diplonema papillatum]
MAAAAEQQAPAASLPDIEDVLHLRPSAVGTYYHRACCDRFLFLSCGPSKQGAELSATGRAHTTRGNEFEEAVWASLKGAADEGGYACLDATEEEPFELQRSRLGAYFVGAVAERATCYVYQLPLARALLRDVLGDEGEGPSSSSSCCNNGPSNNGPSNNGPSNNDSGSCCNKGPSSSSSCCNNGPSNNGPSNNDSGSCCNKGPSSCNNGGGGSGLRKVPEAEFSRALPDLLRVCRGADGSVVVTVIDVKSSAKAKVSHQAQLAVYREIIRSHLRGCAAGAPITVDRIGEVWRHPGTVDVAAAGDGPRPLWASDAVDLTAITAQNRALFRKVRSNAFDEEGTKAAFALSRHGCYQCPHLRGCRAAARGTVRAIGGLDRDGYAALSKFAGGDSLPGLERAWAAAGPAGRVGAAAALSCDVLRDALPHSGGGQPVPKRRVELRAQPAANLPTWLDYEVSVSILREYSKHAGSSICAAFAFVVRRVDNLEIVDGDVVTSDDTAELDARCVELLDDVLSSALLQGARVQVYCQTEDEHTALMQLLGKEALRRYSKDAAAAPRAFLQLADHATKYSVHRVLCRSQGEAAPELLPDLHDSVRFLKLKPKVKKGEWQACAARLGIEIGSKTTKDLIEAVTGKLMEDNADLQWNELEGLAPEEKYTELAWRHALRRREAPAVQAVEAVFRQTFHFPGVVGFATHEELAGFAGQEDHWIGDDTVLESAVEARATLLKQRAAAGLKVVDWVREATSGNEWAGCSSVWNGIPPTLRHGNHIVNELLFVKQHDLFRPEGKSVYVQAEKQKGSHGTVLLRILHGQEHVAVDDEPRGQWLIADLQSEAPPEDEFALGGSNPFPADFFAAELPGERFPWTLLHGMTACDINPKRISHHHKTRLQCYPLGNDTGTQPLFVNTHVIHPPGHPAPFRIEHGRLYRLTKRTVDFNSSKCTAAIGSLYSAGNGPHKTLSPVLSLIGEGPVALGGGPAVALRSKSIAERVDRALTCKSFGVLTASQRAAHEHAFAHRCQLVWGPPGTGKTHYVANHIVRAVFEAAACRDSFRVFVTAMTNAAIKEVMALVEKLLEALFEHPSMSSCAAVDIADLKVRENDRSISVQTQRAASISLPRVDTESELRTPIPPSSPFNTSPSHVQPHASFERTTEPSPRPPSPEPLPTPKARKTQPAYSITYGTVWQILKLTKPEPFDLIVIDEASQLPCTEALAIASLSEDGRLIVAGDQLQLNPIVAAKYPESGGVGVDLTGSLLMALLRNDKNAPVTDRYAHEPLHSSVAKLTENLRSNATICRLTQRLYGADYTVQPASTADTDSRRLHLRSPSHLCPELEALLFEDRKWLEGMLCIVVDVPSVDDKVEALSREAGLVCELAATLEACCENDARKPLSMFALTPTHAQRLAVEERMSTHRKKTGTNSPLSVIDTVNKAQGQTADVAITAYSVPSSDAFLFDIARINVALTRARCLNCLIVSPSVLKPAPSVCDSAETRYGYNHLTAFIDSAAVLRVSFDGSFKGSWQAH